VQRVERGTKILFVLVRRPPALSGTRFCRCHNGLLRIARSARAENCRPLLRLYAFVLFYRWRICEVEKGFKILLVDDHALFREGVARLLGAEPEFEVAGDCGSIEDALQVLKQKSIDLVLLDFYLGERDGKDFLRLASEQGFVGKVLLVTAGVPRCEVVDLVRAGVSGIFLKRDSASLLAQVIRSVIAGGLWFNQEQLQVVMNPQTAPEGQRHRFTAREQQVLYYVFEGFTNRRIAERIGVSTSSVKATLQQLFSKTGVRTRSQLVRVVFEQHRDQI
jgi:DNA-binding NarL/FixJ family response regulator